MRIRLRVLINLIPFVFIIIQQQRNDCCYSCCSALTFHKKNSTKNEYQQQRSLSFIRIQLSSTQRYSQRLVQQPTTGCTSQQRCYNTFRIPNKISKLHTTRNHDDNTILNDTNSLDEGTSSSSSTTATTTTTLLDKPLCYYKNISTRNRWKQRIEMNQLKIGQELNGIIVQELLKGRTGPKCFIDCGIGTYNNKTRKWQIQTAMIRLQRNNKESVIRKKMMKLRTKEYLTVYVSRLYPESNRMEAVLNKEDVITAQQVQPKLQSTSQLRPGQILNGTIVKVCNYGAFIQLDQHYNRLGLLHIQRVADLYHTYIDKEKGLLNAGIEKNVRLQVQVLSNEKKRLFLDFTKNVKDIAEQEYIQEMNHKKNKKNTTNNNNNDSSVVVSTSTTSSSCTVSTDVISEWEEHIKNMEKNNNNDKNDNNTLTTVKKDSNNDDDNNDEEEEEYDDDDDDEEYDDYDEQRDIEDQLGLGSY